MNPFLITAGILLVIIGFSWAKIFPPSNAPTAPIAPQSSTAAPTEAENKLFSHTRELPPYTIVCAKDGRFNFVTKGGYVWPLHDFEYLSDAKELRDRMRAMDERDEREKHVWTPEENRLVEEVAGKHWDICNETP